MHGALYPGGFVAAWSEFGGSGPADSQSSVLRQAEYAIGRRHARAALAALGCAAAGDLATGPGRAPRWPTGFCGSISHVPEGPSGTSAAALAAVARSDTVTRLGVDIERTQGLQPGLWRQVLVAAELAWLQSLPVPDRSAWAHALWSGKEACTKALGTVIDPLALALQVQPDRRNFSVHPLDRVAAPLQDLQGLVVVQPDWVVTLVFAQSA